MMLPCSPRPQDELEEAIVYALALHDVLTGWGARPLSTIALGRKFGFLSEPAYPVRRTGLLPSQSVASQITDASRQLFRQRSVETTTPAFSC
jgi:hypothetical protein